MLQLSSQDAQFLYMESGNNLAHVTSVNIYDPTTVPDGKKIGFKDIVEHMRARLPLSPFLKRKLVRVPFELDFPYWADDEYFDLEAHIHHSRLPEPADWRQFCIHVARYHSRPLDMNRPAWEMYVISGLDSIDGLPKGSFAIATKIHHAAADGAALGRFFATLLDIDNQGTPVISLDSVNSDPTPTPTTAAMARRAFRNNFSSPIKFLGAMRRATPGIYKGLDKLIRASRNKDKLGVPDTRFNVPIAPHKMFNAVPFEFEEFKQLRGLAEGSTINDVVLTVIGGALREYLQHHDELPAEPLHAFVPVNARPKGQDPDEKLGNNLGSMIVQIGSHIEDPSERMISITAVTKQSKAVREGAPAIDMTDLSKHVPNATQIAASKLIMRSSSSFRACNLFVSNVPGPQIPNYMLGAKIHSTYGLAPLNDGMGLFISTPSYLDKMIFSIVSTREVMPDIDFFVGCLKRSLSKANAALMEKAGNTQPKRKSNGKKAGKKRVAKKRFTKRPSTASPKKTK